MSPNFWFIMALLWGITGAMWAGMGVILEDDAAMLGGFVFCIFAYVCLWVGRQR